MTDTDGRTGREVGLLAPTLDRDRLREVLPMLSKRQRQVANMLLAGSSKRNIAHELRLNRRTVDDHISRICDRMSR